MNASGCDSRAAALANDGGTVEKPPAMPHRADDLEHGRRAVDLAALEPGVEAEVVRLAQELDGELASRAARRPRAGSPPAARSR